MNQNNHDTYIVKLKGGMDSYNITSINGTEVMHYFKNKWAKIKIKYGNENADLYDIKMDDEQYKDFLSTFKSKVGTVVEWKVNEFKKENPDVVFNSVSIYPVPSSSDFNEVMANDLIKFNSQTCGSSYL